MNRRDFLVKLGVGTIVAPVLAQVVAMPVEAVSPSKKIGFLNSERINQVVKQLASELERNQPTLFLNRTKYE